MKTSILLMRSLSIVRNMTDIQIAEDLIDMGVPKEDIVLGLQPSHLRQYTQYGVA